MIDLNRDMSRQLAGRKRQLDLLLYIFPHIQQKERFAVGFDVLIAFIAKRVAKGRTGIIDGTAQFRNKIGRCTPDCTFERGKSHAIVTIQLFDSMPSLNVSVDFRHK